MLLHVLMPHNLSGVDEIDAKMVRGLNLNLEEQALPVGKQYMGMSCHRMLAYEVHHSKHKVRAQRSSKTIKITKGNQGIIGDIFCKYFKEFSSMMHPRTAKYVK